LKKFLIFVVIFFLLFPLIPTQANTLKRVESKIDALNFIRLEVNKCYEDYLNTENKIVTAEENLKPLELKINSLSAQIKNLDENIARAEKNIELTKQKSRSIQIELADFFELIEQSEIELVHSKEALNEFIHLAYLETQKFTDLDTYEISPFKFWLTGLTLADSTLRQIYLTVFQKIAMQLVFELQTKQKFYKETKARTLEKRGRLIVLQENLITQKKRLTELRESRNWLLKKTQGEEKEYHRLIDENRDQQAAALLEIENLKEDMKVVDEKLIKLKSQLNEAELEKLIEKQINTGISGLSFPNHTPQLIWPVSPSRGISAYFLDSEYKGVFGVQHYAIDIRARQGSSVKAASPGIVFRAKDNGYGYNYITIVHAGGLNTIYGHILEIFVQEGDIVQAGQLIGLSGGMPGTPGAGYMTTGPHLHFEVIKNKKHQNPLDFLPLEQLPASYIPEEYLGIMNGE
jgi:murein DD-endopeptidase MepM/ murein hydrolase activator NlpD